MSEWIGKQLGHYQIIELIGRGGMAEVYRAQQMSVERDVAVKILTDIQNLDFMARFEREVRLIALLEHIHILPIYDYGRMGEYQYLVMRYLDGGSLNDLLARQQLTFSEIEHFITQVAAALDHAHAHNIIHRDLKPHNILLDRQGNSYLCDFGIAKPILGAGKLTEVGVAIGTPGYMAPEQWRGEAVTAQTDIYALGVMLFEMLTGHMPFEAESVVTLMYQHLQKMPPMLGAYRQGLPPDLDMIVQTALSKNAAERYPTAGALAKEFSQAIHENNYENSPGIHINIATDAQAPMTPAISDTSPTVIPVIDTGALAKRPWVFEAFERWRTSNKTAFLLIGPHGIGKSQVVRQFAERLGSRVLRYELVTTQMRSLDPRVFVESLAVQLLTVLDKRSLQLIDELQSDALIDPTEMLENRVLQPLSGATEPVYLIIDSLEAAYERSGATIIDLLAEALKDWPDTLRLIATTTPDPRLEALFRQAEQLYLRPDSEENRADLHATLSTRFATLIPNLSKGEVDLLALEEKSEGNPLYLMTVIEALTYKRLSVAELADLPAGLDALYALLTHKAEQADAQAGRLLRVLAVARAPLSSQMLANILHERNETIRAVLSNLRPLVRYSAPGWELGHRALHYWLIHDDAEGVLAGHRAMADVLKQALPTDTYALQHLPAHLLAAQQWQDAYALLTDLNFLAAQLAELSLGEVVDSVYYAQLALSDQLPQQAALLKYVLNTLHTHARALTYDKTNAFGHLYNALSGVAELSEALTISAAQRRTPWLRLAWPIRSAEAATGQIIWQGAPILSLAATTRQVNDAPQSRWLADCADGKLRLWDNGTLLREWTTRSDPWHGAICTLSDDGRWAAGVVNNDTVQVWDVDNDGSVSTLSGHQRAVTGCALSHDSRQALTSCDDRLLRLWDVESGKLLQSFYLHPDSVSCCTFAYDGDRTLALSGSVDGMLRIWNIAGNVLLQTLKAGLSSISACTASLPDMAVSIAVTGSIDGKISVWSLKNGGLLHSLSGHTAAITALAIGTYDGNTVIVSASQDRTVRVWSLKTEQQIVRFDGHTQAVTSCAFGPDQQLLSGSLDGTLRTWDIHLTDRKAIETHGAAITGCVFTADSKHLLTAALDRELRLWDGVEGKVLRTYRGHTGGINACALRSDDQVALSASTDGTLRVWGVKSGAMLRMLTGHSGPVLACAISPKPIHLVGQDRVIWLAASGGADRTLRLWNLDNGHYLWTFKDHIDTITACAFSPTDNILASAAKDRTVRLWSIDEQALLKTINLDSAAMTCSFSPDGQHLLIGSTTGELLLHTIDADDTITLGEAAGAVVGCGFSDEGHFIFAISADKFARLWDTQNYQLLATFQADQPLSAGAFATDNVTLAAADSKGVVYSLKLEPQVRGRRKTQS